MQKHIEADVIISRQLSALEGRIPTSRIRKDIEMVYDMLEKAPQWQPKDIIQSQCRMVLQILKNLEQRIDRKLVVTIVGPTGSGKSTLLNALAGVDDLSDTGHQRPTTRDLVVLCQKESDAGQLIEDIGGAQVMIRTSRAALSLNHVMLIDTPDTDSTKQEDHIHLVRKVIGLSDVLICVFDAENPKRLDHADFMADYITLFHGESLGVVLNKCDRQAEDELKQRIAPEFSRYLSSAWNIPIKSVLCISARRNVNHPQWNPKARPKHDFDQFYLLREMVFGVLNSDSAVVDRRFANAGSLRNYIINKVRSDVDQDREALLHADADIIDAEKKALRNAVKAMARDDHRQTIGINVLLYQKLAQRWMGPVGWIVAVWARILIFGTGLAAIFRFGNPVRQIWGMVSSLRHFKESRSAVEDTSQGENLNAAILGYRKTIMQQWPQIAEILVTARFDHSVRRIEHALPKQDKLVRELSIMWRDALENALEKAANHLSGFPLQLLFNIPVFTVLVLTGVRTTRDFIAGNYLTSDFFLHAFFTMGIILFLSFFILQACVRMVAGPDRLIKNTFSMVEKQVGKSHPLPLNDISRQIHAVLGSTGTGHRPD